MARDPKIFYLKYYLFEHAATPLIVMKVKVIPDVFDVFNMYSVVMSKYQSKLSINNKVMAILHVVKFNNFILMVKTLLLLTRFFFLCKVYVKSSDPRAGPILIDLSDNTFSTILVPMYILTNRSTSRKTIMIDKVNTIYPHSEEASKI